MAEKSYATGRRKNATARVWLSLGKGEMIVNGKPVDEYFTRKTLELNIRKPFEITDTVDQFDVYATVSGGGISGQAEAIRHGISRALAAFDIDRFRPKLKAAGFLTRDPRMVERKKYGLHKARKRPQFSKR
ncbi:MAG TPA: 30S ribosomal protein S9 [Deltaproteobacteria bacterium]|nr:30S ribosomal protein S9 [Deltaproteobacteria bacterium]HOM28068.1 30S ribosomal protein S9 [Deltaproteobacteria bacterium]HPP81189.1 30S ribosomal protein S9 [Deltaproteobacteria bacterium]